MNHDETTDYNNRFAWGLPPNLMGLWGISLTEEVFHFIFLDS